MEIPVYRIWHRGGEFPLVRVVFPPALNQNYKPFFGHDPAYHFLGNSDSFTDEQGVYPAVSVTPAVFMKQIELLGNNSCSWAGQASPVATAVGIYL